MLTCAMCIDPTWPPYVAETIRMAGYKATPLVFTCVPALHTSSYNDLYHVGGKIHLLGYLNVSNLLCFVFSILSKLNFLQWSRSMSVR